ncbi:MAG: ABC transporter permease [Lachnospiraceae bacterium]|nr:ABC transporter permease [Lachnospiraceae bacterium]
MLAVYKKELRSYFTSVIGYLFIGLLLLILSFLFYNINIIKKNAFIGYVFEHNYLQIVLMILIPVMTMKIFADERHSKTDQMLFTAPVKIFSIVMGKFLAIATMFTIPMLVFCFYPLVLSDYGTIPWLASYNSIFGFWLMGLSAIAIGVFISSITENQIMSAVVTFVILLVSFACFYMNTSFPNNALASVIFFSVIAALLALIVFAQLKSNVKIAIMCSGGFLAVCVIALVVIYFVKEAWLVGAIQSFLLKLSLYQNLSHFCVQYFDIVAVVYNVSIIVFCLFLTNQSLEKRRWN